MSFFGDFNRAGSPGTQSVLSSSSVPEPGDLPVNTCVDVAALNRRYSTILSERSSQLDNSYGYVEALFHAVRLPSVDSTNITDY